MRAFRPRPFSEWVNNIMPSWFTVTMGTGIVPLLLMNMPFKHPSLRPISIVMFTLSAVIFTGLSILTILRYGRYPRAVKQMLLHPIQSNYVGCIAMGFAQLVSAAALLWTDNSTVIMITYVAFWIDVFLTIISIWIVGLLM